MPRLGFEPTEVAAKHYTTEPAEADTLTNYGKDNWYWTMVAGITIQFFTLAKYAGLVQDRFVP